MADRTDSILNAYGLEGAEVTLINVSENQTYQVETRAGEKYIWRRYREASRSAAQIEAELDWMEAIRRETDVSVPGVVAAAGGRRMVVDEAGGQHVIFTHLAGEAPPEDDLLPWFARLGAISAKLHKHGRRRMARGAARPVYDFESLVGPVGIWGNWQDAPGLLPKDVELVARAAAAIGERLRALGPDSRSLIHGDLRLANLLVDGERLHVIDFDDCGTGWRMFDLATALSLIEEADEAPAAARSWLDGYETVQPVSAAERAAIPDLIMLRRIQVMAWFASHPDTDLAKAYAEPTIAATVAAADVHLSGKSRFIQ